MSHLIRTLTCIVIALTTFAARAAEPAAPAQADVISKLVGPDTVVVTHIDLSRADPKAAADQVLLWLNRMKLEPNGIDEATRGVREGALLLASYRERLTKAGGKHIYVLTSLFDVPVEPGAVVVTLEAGADANAVIALLGQPGFMRFGGRPWPEKNENIAGALVFGSADAVARVKASAAAPKARPEVAEALASTADLPLQIAMVPTADNRRVIDAMVPRLPQQLGGGSGAILTRGIQWASAGVDLGDKPSLKLIIRSADADAAKALHDVIKRSAQWLQQAARGKPEIANLPQVVERLTPAIQGDSLVLSLDEQAFDVLVDAAAPAFAAARENAKMQVSSSQMRQILIACVLFANDNKGQWPDTLEQAIPKYAPATVLIDPRRPDRKVGYVYLKPGPDEQKNPGTAIILHEITDGRNKVFAGFADGHVELMLVEQLEKQLKAAPR